MKKTEKRWYSRFVMPLHIHLSVMFVTVVAGSCLLQIWASSKSIDNIIFEANQTLFEQIATTTKGDFEKVFQPAMDAISTLELTELIDQTREYDRIPYLTILQKLLHTQPGVNAYFIGYSNGDVLAAFKNTQSSWMTDIPVPKNAELFGVMSSYEKGYATLFFFSVDGKVIGSQIISSNDLDARKETWYQAAKSNEMSLARPKFFKVQQQIGVTVQKRSETGTVIAAEILLSSVSNVLAGSAESHPSTRLLFEKNQRYIYAFSEGSSHRLSLSELETIDQLPFPNIRSFILDESNVAKGLKTEMIDGEKWFGEVFPVANIGDKDFHLLFAIKESELLDKAAAIRHHAIATAFILALLVLPIVYIMAQFISRPIRLATQNAQDISHFKFDAPNYKPSRIKEIVNLSKALKGMNITIRNFFELTRTISKQKDSVKIQSVISEGLVKVTQAQSAFLSIWNPKEDRLEAHIYWDGKTKDKNDVSLAYLDSSEKICDIYSQVNGDEYLIYENTPEFAKKLRLPEEVWWILVPLYNRDEKCIGCVNLAYLNEQKQSILDETLPLTLVLTGYTSLAIETKKHLREQKELLEAFIRVIAGAIDTKSPYTGNHCQRVPVLTERLVTAAAESDLQPFNDFSLTADEQEALHIASWLHDCGKVTTPEYVVDKSTKLETIYNRIHEIRTRFEVLKRDAQIDAYQSAFGSLPIEQQAQVDEKWRQLDEDFTFIAQMNEGNEFLSEEHQQRIHAIAGKTWQRTLDSRLGLGQEEAKRYRDDANDLPVTESLLADKPSHRIPWESSKIRDARFQLQPKQYKNDQGELYNLCIQRGTLNDEERFIINDHIIETMMMLESLPFPSTMKNIPLIAGSHHEKLDGKGYPQGIDQSEIPLAGKAMAIADIFEALTSSDRPYKKAKTLSESLNIMRCMVKDNHIDADLFALFLNSGIYMEYAKQFLLPEQIDQVNVADYLA
ncbi:HD-GYP domain-containing protein [Vibrio diazotrophicus]|uniref:HD-GYP domain-containing protein n=1 Tax=Vibrio diazotrophicus TaxID=685 RepID=UPI00142E3BF3|nr:HD domain-containing phosphohydrolase [Vibrio diazotrophicus]NIY92349.1 phosphohydrolase [Vibrio diazotrophicus]